MGQKRTINKKRLTKKEVKDIVSSGATLDQEFTKFFEQTFATGEIQKDLVYRLPANQVLYVFADNDISSPGRGDIYAFAYFLKWIKQIKRTNKNYELNRGSSVEHWRYYSKNGVKIIDNNDKLVEELSEKLQISKAKLNVSYESLDLISDKLNSLDLDFIFENLYDNLVAYVGEVIKQRVQGHWEINTTHYGGDYPFISIDLKNVQYMPINAVWSSLNEIDPHDLRKEAANEVRSQASRAKFEREFGDKIRASFGGK